MSKREQAVGLMKANANKSMAEVVALIAKSIDVTESNAKSYYRYIVKHNLAPGKVEASGRGRKTAAPKATAKVKAEKAVKAVKQPKAPKPADKIAEIRKQNLERMREVAARRKLPEAVDVSDEAMDSFTMPKFLSKSQLKELL